MRTNEELYSELEIGKVVRSRLQWLGWIEKVAEGRTLKKTRWRPESRRERDHGKCGGMLSRCFLT